MSLTGFVAPLETLTTIATMIETTARQGGNMAQRKKTIKEMQDDCARVYHFVPKPCELAEGKAQRGHYVARAWNRQGAQRQEIRPAKMPAVLATLARNGW